MDPCLIRNKHSQGNRSSQSSPWDPYDAPQPEHSLFHDSMNTSGHGSRQDARQTLPSENIIIAVFGMTGTGKSSFIEKVSGKSLKIGHSLRSCTTGIIEIEFEIGQYKITLVDTPGFDDTSKSDTEILLLVANWLEKSYKRGTLLSGVIYLHRISDIRMTNSSIKSLGMFRKLCGSDNLKNVSLVTTMWDKVTPEEGAARENELSQQEDFWRCMIASGATIKRYDGTRECAISMILDMVKHKPVIIKLQQEIAAGKRLIETDVGAFIYEEITKMQEKHKQELQHLREEIEEAMERNNKDLEQVLEAKHARTLAEVKQMAEEKMLLQEARTSRMEQQLQREQERNHIEITSRERYVPYERRESIPLHKTGEQGPPFHTTASFHDNKSLMEAVIKGGKYTVQKLLFKNGVDVNFVDEDRRTPLSWAAEKGHEAICKLLLENGADINSEDRWIKTPLHYAVGNKHEDIVMLLLKGGADANVKDIKNHWTPLFYAVDRNREDLVWQLIDKGAKINFERPNMNTPLHEAAKAGYRPIVRLLLEKGANVNAARADRRTPLHLAAKSGDETTARLLLEKGANINATGLHMCTPLHLAAVFGKETMVRLLLQRGANVNAKESNDFGGWTPLHYAVVEGHDAVVRQLIEKGADIKAEGAIDKSTPLDFAAKKNFGAIVKLLLDNTPRNDWEARRIRTSDWSIYDQLLEKGFLAFMERKPTITDEKHPEFW